MRLFILLIMMLLVACGGGSSSKPNPPSNNQAPTVNAGVDQLINEQVSVLLSGSASDIDGSVSSTQWRQIEGPKIEFSTDSTALELSFIAPIVLAYQSDQILTFSLTATDNEGKHSVDTVTITVKPINELPIAYAGEDQTYLIAETIRLDCGDSRDVDSDDFTVEWRQLSGESVEIKENSSCQSNIKLPARAGELEFQLNVTDGDLITVSDIVIITVKNYEGERNEIGGNPLFRKSSYNYFGDYVTNIGSYTYLALGQVLHIIDTSNVTTPRLVSELTFQGELKTKLKVIGTTGFQLIIKDEGSEIVVIDLSDPQTPSIVGEIIFDGWLMSFDIKGNYIYALNTDGLVVFDITEILAPQVVSMFELDFMGVIANELINISGNIAYVTSTNFLHTFDISLPVLPILKSTVLIDESIPLDIAPISARNLIIVDNFIYINVFHDYGSLDSGISIFDISQSGTPVFIKKIITKGNNYSLDVLNDKAYILASAHRGVSTWETSSWPSWLDVYELKDKTKPIYLGEVSISKGLTDLTVSDGFIYTNSAIYEQPLFSTLLTIGQIELLADAKDISVEGTTVFVSTEDKSVAIVNVNDTTSPTVMSNIETSGDVEAVYVKNNTLYVGLKNADSGLNIYDIAEPTAPKLLSAFGSNSNSVSSLVLEGNTIYLSNLSLDGLQLVDVSNKEVPTLLDSVVGSSSSGEIADTAILNGFAYSVFKNNFYEFDISQPNDIKLGDILEGPVSYGLMSSIDIDNNNVFIITNTEYESSSCINSLNMSIVWKLEESDKTCFSDTAGKVHRDGTLLYVPWKSEGLMTFDISSSQAEIIANYRVGNVRGVAVNDGKTYVTNEHGLTIFDSINRITSEQNYYDSSASSALNYQLNWQIDSAVTFQCFVTAGACSISIDKTQKTAVAIWTLPEISGDYEIAIVGGNNAFYNIHRDKVIVH